MWFKRIPSQVPLEHRYELCRFAIQDFHTTAFIIDDHGTIGIHILGEAIGSITDLPSVPNIHLLPAWETQFDSVDIFVLINHITRAWKQRAVTISRAGVLVLSTHVDGALDILHNGIQYELIPDQYEGHAYLTGRTRDGQRYGTGLIRRTGLFRRYQIQCPSRQFQALRQFRYRRWLLDVARNHLRTCRAVRPKRSEAASVRPTPKPSPSPRPGGVPSPTPRQTGTPSPRIGEGLPVSTSAPKPSRP